MTQEELRDYVELVRSQNRIPYDIYSELLDGIDTLEQEPVLDKIRAEIEDLADADAYGDYQQGFNFGLMRAVQIIDKYIESEVKNDNNKV